ncbi:MAG: ABC transporter permease subunit [Micrococcales bacterium]|nr:ABC transporter permease subunit [Micrococcales bacterium]
MVVYSFNTGRNLQVFQGFGVTAFTSALGNPVILQSIQVSLIISAGSAVVSTILGTFAGIALGRRPGRWAPPLLVVLGLVLVTPEIVNALSLLPWFVSLGVNANIAIFNNGFVRLIVAVSLFAATLVTFIVRSRVAGMDASLEEAAADLYAPPLRRFTSVTLPVIRPAVISGALLAFTVSLDETVIASFVSVAGTTPWPVYIFSATRAALRPEVAAMSTLVLVLTLAVLGVVVLVLRRSSGGEVGGTAQLARDLVG